MKISRLEFVSFLLAAVFLAFTAGWFLRGARSAQPIQVEAARPAETAAVLPVPSGAANPEASSELVNINTADSETLQTLPGIGEKRAEDIIQYREKYGPFHIPEEITRVSGIGSKTLEEIRDRITVE